MEADGTFKLFNALNVLYECKSSEQLPQAVERIFLCIIPLEYVGWYDISENKELIVHSHYPRALIDQLPDVQGLMRWCFEFHPFKNYFLGGGTRTVVRLSEFEFPAEWPRHPDFESLKRLGEKIARNKLGTCLRRPGEGWIMLALGRSTCDFSEEEIGLVEQTMEHVKRRAEALELIRRAELAPALIPDDSAIAENLCARHALSPREAEVAFWASLGKCNETISAILEISPHTVRTLLQRSYPKMGVKNRASLAHAVWSLQSFGTENRGL